MSRVTTFYIVLTGGRTKKKEFDFGWYDCELDQELLHLQGRELNSSRFVFSEDCTIVSYVPKKNKNVLVLSTMHNDDRVSDGKSSKPDIILHYNNTKGGEDNLDKMASTYSRQRMTTRWLLVMFYIIDVSAYNAYVLWTEKHLTWNAGLLHKRQLLLEKLGKALVQPERMRRKTLPRTAAASRQLKGCEKMLSSHLQAPPLIRIEVVKNEPDVNCVFQATARQAHFVKNAKNTFVKIIHSHISHYDREIDCASPMGQFDPEDKSRK
ncbi:hypothetical protein T4A_8383 [Trichinella pseudospiralis]|uniref:PiggyBac transposable element-derived protein domain-containing protein n=1 Tax=Trichinella pseudospiralis TaxID=6337 RepID=A0A0V1E9D9_TRIPS|nr:hypothetical protein T4A_8383 [Trichinella pseudospiralis]